ncbi:tetratricopeptide repeat protein 33 [Strongylocentrotus purpuratus]|uniref:Tetratricopeptide repeat protein 33 n=1 Tax=Strongylocentrotus purpuratus TaxID=7668 RepID=A0A7M7GIK7_STRPU|nr:tetratricopeptide repeat protein 33 [Strongylocentrotus purpuratus]|eukprot:XP_003728867.1 PREDICTED: tetratricopeptide repeat protein 33 [Strongylocentrotus purpuratus]
MTSFGWKRKVGEKVSKEASSNFESKTGLLQEDSSGEDGHHEDNLWDSFSKKRKVLLLEDAASKSQRLKAEGETLADAGRFWEALNKWNDALQYTPANEHLHEMKAQVLMELHEVFPAVEAAQQATVLAPQWWVAYQTLGRAQIGLGEITMAVKSFSRAVHMNPAEPTLWEEDLSWAYSLRDQLGARTKTRTRKREGQKETQVSEPVATSEPGTGPSRTGSASRSSGDGEDGQELGSAARKTEEAEDHSMEEDTRTVTTPDDRSSGDASFCREGFR